MSVLDRLSDLEASATPGSWYLHEGGVASRVGPGWVDWIVESSGQGIEDAALIAEARNCLPALIAVARAAQASAAAFETMGGFPDLLAALEALEAE